MEREEGFGRAEVGVVRVFGVGELFEEGGGEEAEKAEGAEGEEEGGGVRGDGGEREGRGRG